MLAYRVGTQHNKPDHEKKEKNKNKKNTQKWESKPSSRGKASVAS